MTAGEILTAIGMVTSLLVAIALLGWRVGKYMARWEAHFAAFADRVHNDFDRIAEQLDKGEERMTKNAARISKLEEWRRHPTA